MPLVIAEDSRNLATIVRPRPKGWGLDAVWSDDLHHQLRRHLAGDREGYYADFTGRTADIAETTSRGWFFTGQRSEYGDTARGTDPSGIPLERFVVCIQNHDQVGNRALGERLHYQIDPAAYRAAVVLLALCPETPLLFMGQEWAASSPFQFFTSHGDPLGPRVTDGRRREFRHFSAFSDPEAQKRIPDPESSATFERSRLKWEERDRGEHAKVLALHRVCFRLRRDLPDDRRFAGARALDDETVSLLYENAGGQPAVLAVIRLGGAGTVAVDRWPAGSRITLTTEDGRFAGDPSPIAAGPTGDRFEFVFGRAGAIVLVEGE